MKALALDLGASGGKFLFGSFDGSKLTVKEIHTFANEPVETNGHLTWDFQHIYSSLLDGLSKTLPEKISSFGVDSFCNDYGLLDGGGNLISPIYMYRDHRTDGILEQMDQAISPQEFFKRTGCQRAQFNTLVQLVAQTQSTDRYILDDAESLLFIPDLLNHFLTGEKVAEYTIASVSQVYNQVDKCWDEDILRSFKIPGKIFPKVIPPATKVGTIRPTILPQIEAERISVCAVGHHDTASAVAAVPSLDPHFAYISSGTWSLMGTETSEMITTESAFRHNFANEGGLEGRNRFLKNIMGLWLLQECQRQFASIGVKRTFAEMEQEAEGALPFRSIINPDDPSFFHPGDMVSRIQQKCRQHNQPVPITVGEVTRCIQESLALAYRATFQIMEQIIGYSLPRIHILGGGAKSPLLNQFTASALKVPVLAGPYMATAIGNLCAQIISRGEIKDLNEARSVILRSFDVIEFLPGRDTGWDEAFGRYQHIVKSTPPLD